MLQESLIQEANRIKGDRTDEDLLFHVLLDWGVELTLPIEQVSILGKAVFKVGGNTLIACFEQGITEDLARAMASEQPLRAVFRDDGFISDAVKINAVQIFKQLSPSTEVKAL